MAATEYVQCYLKHLTTGGFTTMWLDCGKAFKVGSVITLRGTGPPGEWEVLRKGAMRLPKESLNTEWAVGGLSGRKDKAKT